MTLRQWNKELLFPKIKENWQAFQQPNQTEEKIQVNKVEIQRFYYNR